MAEEWEEYLDEASGDLYYSNGVVTTWDIADTLTTPTQPSPTPTPSPIPQPLIEAAPTEALKELPHDELNQPKEEETKEIALVTPSPSSLSQSEALLTEELLENELTEEKEVALVPEDITTDTHTIETKRPQSFIVQNQVLTSAKAKLKSNIITQEEYLQIVQSQEIHDVIDSAPLLGSNSLSHDKEAEDMERIAKGTFKCFQVVNLFIVSLYYTSCNYRKNHFYLFIPLLMCSLQSYLSIKPKQCY